MTIGVPEMTPIGRIRILIIIPVGIAPGFGCLSILLRIGGVPLNLRGLAFLLCGSGMFLLFLR